MKTDHYVDSGSIHILSPLAEGLCLFCDVPTSCVLKSTRDHGRAAKATRKWLSFGTGLPFSCSCQPSSQISRQIRGVYRTRMRHVRNTTLGAMLRRLGHSRSQPCIVLRPFHKGTSEGLSGSETKHRWVRVTSARRGNYGSRIGGSVAKLHGCS